jgi:hypothetical protein
MRRTPRAKERALPGASCGLACNHTHHTSAIIKFFRTLAQEQKAAAFFFGILLSVMFVAL